MPKNRKVSSSSESDSGPDDRNPPPSKKSKEVEKKPSSTSNKGKRDTEETRWVLEKLRFVNINEFRGRKTVDIREFYEKDGDYLPGKKGISLSITQWKKLLEIAEEVNAALEC